MKVSRESGHTETRIIGRELERSMQLICDVCDVLECFLDVRYVLSIQPPLTTVYVLVLLLVQTKMHVKDNLLFDILAMARESLTCISRAVAL